MLGSRDLVVSIYDREMLGSRLLTTIASIDLAIDSS